jgi:hypothetical protein
VARTIANHFIEVPEDVSSEIQELSTLVSYGWGVIPVSVRIGDTRWTTSLFPKDRRYLVPIKDAVRAAERITLGELVLVEMALRQ